MFSIDHESNAHQLKSNSYKWVPGEGLWDTYGSSLLNSFVGTKNYIEEHHLLFLILFKILE